MRKATTIAILLLAMLWVIFTMGVSCSTGSSHPPKFHKGDIVITKIDKKVGQIIEIIPATFGGDNSYDIRFPAPSPAAIAPELKFAPYSTVNMEEFEIEKMPERIVENE